MNSVYFDINGDVPCFWLSNDQVCVEDPGIGVSPEM